MVFCSCVLQSLWQHWNLSSHLTLCLSGLMQLRRTNTTTEVKMKKIFSFTLTRCGLFYILILFCEMVCHGTLKLTVRCLYMTSLTKKIRRLFWNSTGLSVELIDTQVYSIVILYGAKCLCMCFCYLCINYKIDQIH